MKRYFFTPLTFLLSYTFVTGQYKRILTDADKINTPFFNNTLKKRTAKKLFTMPMPEPSNKESAIGSKIDSIRDMGLRLKGEGITIALFESLGKPLITHTEFLDTSLSNSRITVAPDNTCGVDSHATQVAGTITALGADGNAKGMAPSALIRSFDSFTSTCLSSDWTVTNFLDKIRAELGSQNSLISNHSYNYSTGYYKSGSTWYWGAYRNTDFGLTTEDYMFGFYSEWDKNIDQMLYNAPYHSMVFSTGNENGSNGNLGKPADGFIDGGYDCIPWGNGSKNIISVGAIQQSAAYQTMPNINIASFSSMGPMDDGRIKPDIVAVGTNVYTTHSNGGYISGLGGTSFAAPVVTGGLALIQEYAKKTLGNYLFGATAKALIINSAGNIGLKTSPTNTTYYLGPNYKYGWGLFDAKKATAIIAKTSTSTYILEGSLTNGETKIIYLRPTQNYLNATLAWYDPEGTPVYDINAGTGPDAYIQANPGVLLDNRTKLLVNDLDLKIEQSGITYHPWTLDPNNPATPPQRGVSNNTDNVEGTTIYPSEMTKGIIKLTISHKGMLLNGSQKFGLIIDGVQDAYQLTTVPNSTGTNTLLGTDFNNPANWSLGRLPLATEAILIDPTVSAIEFTADTTLTANPLYANPFVPITIKSGKTLTIKGSVLDEGYIKVEATASLNIEK